jgi:hypothetical protein
MNPPPAPLPTYPLSYCQWRLAALWLGATLVLTVLLLAQIAGGVYGDKGVKAQAWLMPNLLPTLAMIGGAIAYQMTQRASELAVTRFAYRATWWFSLIYLLLVLATIGFGPLARERLGIDALEWLAIPAPVLTGLSAIASAALGAFFVSSKPTAEAAAESKPGAIP